MTYSVGDVLYLLSNKNLSVLPCMVIEEIIRKTIAGAETTYIIVLPDKNGSKVRLDELDVKTFKDVEKLRDYMISNAKESINDLILGATGSASKIFIKDATLDENLFADDHKNSSSVDLNTSDLENVQDKKIHIDLGDGRKASIKVENLIGVENENTIA